jgi:hypothetical protein
LIYFGQNGEITISRDSASGGFDTDLDPADVNTTKKRFSVDHSLGSLISGDRVEISTVDKSTLELVSSHSHPDGTWFVHIDRADGIRLFNTFEKAVKGLLTDALTLVAPSATQEINIKTKNNRYRHVANIKEFEITTNRDQVDTTTLGKEFRDQYESGLISGQGSMTCLWEHFYDNAELKYGDAGTYPELPVYLAQLMIRLQQGADFDGRFHVYKNSSDNTQNVYYQSKCIVTNAALSVSATNEIETRIEFVTSGEIQLLMGAFDSFLLGDGGTKLLQEGGDNINIEG